MRFLSDELDSWRRTLPPVEREELLSTLNRNPNEDSRSTYRLPDGVMFRAYKRDL